MINEAIHFIKKFNEESEGSAEHSLDHKIEQIAQRHPKIIIINASFNNEEIKYEGFTFLISEEENKKIPVSDKIEFNGMAWLKNNPSVIDKLKFNRYVHALSEANKYIGSTGGLASFSLFHFRIRSDWFSFNKRSKFNFDEKIGRFKFNKNDLKQFRQGLDENGYTQVEILNSEKGVRKIYFEFLDDIIQKFDFDKETIGEYDKKKLSETDLSNLSDREKEIKEKVEGIRDLFDNTYVYVNIDNLVISEDASLDSFLLSRIFITQETIIENDSCPLCKMSSVKTGVPTSYNALNITKQVFNVHNDKVDKYNIRICSDCAINFNGFEQFLKEHRIDFFPLFVEGAFKAEEIKYLKQRRNREGFNFFDIIGHILTNVVEDELDLDFILLHHSVKGILYYDYVNNYRFKLGKYGEEYKGYLTNQPSYQLNLKNLMGKFDDKTILGLKPYYIFNDLHRGLETYRKYLIYKYRQKIFDLIYRNNRALSGADIAEIVTVQLEKRIRNGESMWPRENKDSKDKELLEFYLNSHLFVLDPAKFIQKNGGINMLEQIRKEKEGILENDADPIIDSDEKFAYYLGQIAYYLISQSETSDDKKMGLLTPILSCQSPQSIQRVMVEKYLDKYGYKLKTYHDFRHKILSSTLDYLNSKLNVPFGKIKIPFYVGFFDENIFYQSTKK